MQTVQEIFKLEVSEKDIKFPATTELIAKEQQIELQTSERLKEMVKLHQDYKIQKFNGIDIIYYKNKIYITKTLQMKVIKWYHHYLCYPGATRLIMTLGQSMSWDGMNAQCKT